MTKTESTGKTLLVTGAGGQLGRQAIESLLEKQQGPIIATTRHPEKLADLAARGVDVRKADFDEPESLAAAFAGADRLLLISTDALGSPGQRLTQHRAAVRAAEEAGVEHVVYLSAPAPHPTPEPGLINDHYWTEQALAASPLGWTILRDHIYTDFLLMSLPHAIATGVLHSAAGDGGRNYVTRADCARTAAAVLADPASGRFIYDVTGPAPVTQAELAAIASELSGKAVAYVAITPEQSRAGMTAAGLPPFLIDGLLSFDAAAAQGFHAITTSVVKDWTGREPTSVRDYLSAHRGALAAGA